MPTKVRLRSRQTRLNSTMPKPKAETQEEIIERLRVPSFSDIPNFRPRPPTFDYSFALTRSHHYPVKETNRHVRVLKTSMRFVPLLNNAPNEYGNPSDPPYLFAVKGKPLNYSRNMPKTKHGPVGCIPRPTLPEEEEEYNTVTLEWPANPKSLVKRVHQGLLVSYMDYYNEASLNNKLPDDTPMMYGMERHSQSLYTDGLKKVTEKYYLPEDYDGPDPTISGNR